MNEPTKTFTIEDLRQLVDKFRMAPILTKIEVNDMADLRRYVTGGPAPATDRLGVGQFGGVPVHENWDVHPRTARLTRSDGSTEVIPL